MPEDDEEGMPKGSKEEEDPFKPQNEAENLRDGERRMTPPVRRWEYYAN